MMQINIPDEGDIENIAACHRAAFPDAFLTQLGNRCLEKYYEFYRTRQDAILLIAKDDDSILGLVAGGRPDLNQLFIRTHYPMLFWWVGVAGCRRAAVRKRAWFHFTRSLRNRLPWTGGCSSVGSGPIQASWGRWANLLSIGVRPKAQGQGLGKLLMAAFQDECRRQHYQFMRLSVHNDNEAARRLYLSQGWKVLKETDSGTYFGREV